MKNNKKGQLVNKYTPSGVTEQLPPAPKYMGGSGAFGLVGGAGVKAAKGAIQIVKNLLTRGSKPKNIGGFREFANPKLRDHFNKVPKSKPRTTSIPNPIPNSTKAYNKLQYPMGKKAFSSKPVEFMGPNPANKIGAGKNSYPK
jgi:hypothetical protein